METALMVPTLENMYPRDATGIRNPTVGGLSGTLGSNIRMERSVQQLVLIVLLIPMG